MKNMANRKGRRVGAEVVTQGPNIPVTRTPKMVALTEPDERGVHHRMGETHHHAKHPDELVEAIRDEYQRGVVGYKKLVKKYGLSKRTVRDIVNYNRRNTWADKWKRQED